MATPVFLLLLNVACDAVLTNKLDLDHNKTAHLRELPAVFVETRLTTF